MQRRKFIALLVAAAAVWPARSLAREPDRIRKVGVLWGQAHDPEWLERFAAFTQQLQKLGWIEGKNISFEIRHAAGKPDQFPAIATELVETSPDVILAGTAGLAAIARNATDTVPIVVTNAGELEGTGLIASLRRPGWKCHRHTNPFTRVDEQARRNPEATGAGAHSAWNYGADHAGRNYHAPLHRGAR